MIHFRLRRAGAVLGLACLWGGLPGLAGAEEAPPVPQAPPPSAAPPAPRPLPASGPGSVPPSAPASAPPSAPTGLGPRAFGGDPLRGGFADEVRLPLDQALRWALERNLELMAGAYDPWIACERVTAQEGLFDTLLTAGFGAGRIETPVNTTFLDDDVTRDDTVQVYAGLARRLKTGGQLSVLFTADRLYTTSSLATTNPNVSQGVTIEYLQPLLRGAGYVATADIRLARVDARAADARLKALTEDVLFRVERAYWDLVFAGRQVEARRKSERVAQELLEQTQARYDAKIATVLDLADARAGLEGRRGARIASEGLAGQLEDALRALIMPFDASNRPHVRLVAVDDPHALSGRDAVDLERGEDRYVAQAVRGRPDLAEARAHLETRTIDVEKARDGLRPRLDLVARLSSSGLDDEGWDATTGVFRPEAYGSYVGLNFSMFLGRRSAWADVRAADWGRRQSGLQVRELENRVVQEVRFALREIATARARLVAATEEAKAAQEALEGEQLKERNGESTPFRVLEKEDVVRQAELLGNRAAADVKIATARLWRSVGLLAETRGVGGPARPK